jgi:hypothetical protein
MNENEFSTIKDGSAFTASSSIGPESSNQIGAQASDADPNFGSDNEIKDYILEQRPISVPKRFRIGRCRAGARIESLAARFIYLSRPWWGYLDEWERAVLSVCFGFAIEEKKGYRGSFFYAATARRPFPRWAQEYVEFLEDLWEFEYRLAIEVDKARRIIGWLAAQEGHVPSKSQECNWLTREWLAKMAASMKQLRAIVAQQYLLMDYIVWPNNDQWNPYVERLVTNYRNVPPSMWLDSMEALCKQQGVPKSIVSSRLKQAQHIHIPRHRGSRGLVNVFCFDFVG